MQPFRYRDRGLKYQPSLEGVESASSPDALWREPVSQLSQQGNPGD